MNLFSELKLYILTTKCCHNKKILLYTVEIKYPSFRFYELILQKVKPRTGSLIGLKHHLFKRLYCYKNIVVVVNFNKIFILHFWYTRLEQGNLLSPRFAKLARP